MIRHVVLFKFLDEASGSSKEQNIVKARKFLESLPGKIPEILNLETGLNVKDDPPNYDLALIVDFDSIDDLETYINHPDHKKVGEFLAKVRDNRVVVDFEIP
jgi:hypothetical protein